MARGTRINFKNYKRVQDTLQRVTSSYDIFESKHPKISHNTIFRNVSSNRKTITIKRHRGEYASNRVPLNNVPEEEDKRRKSSYLQPQRSKRLCMLPGVSPNQPATNSLAPKKWRSYDENRYFAGIFSRARHAQSPEVPLTILPRNRIPDDMPPVWTSERSFGFRENNKLGSTTIETGANESRSIFRRLPHHPRRRRDLGKPGEACDDILNEPRMAGEPVKIILSSLNQNRILGNHLGHNKEYQESVRDQSLAFADSHPRPHKEKAMELARRESNPRQPELCIIGSTIRQASLSHNTEIIETPPIQKTSSQVWHTGTSAQRTELVVGEHSQKHPDSSRESHNIYNHRRSRGRLGCYSEQPPDTGQVVTYATAVAQQLERTLDCIRSSLSPGMRNLEQNCHAAVRQPNYSCIHKQARRHKVHATTKSHYKNSYILREDEVSADRSVHTRCVQRNSRQSIKEQVSPGVASQPANAGCDIPEIRHATNRSIRVQEVGSSPNVCQRGCCRSAQLLHRCVQPDVAIQTRVDIPTTSINTTYTTPSGELEGTVPNCSPYVGASLLETGPETTCRGTAFRDSEPSREPYRPSHEASTTGSRPVEVGGLAGSGWSKYIEGWSENQVKLLESSWRKSTLKTYKPIWMRWRKWAASNNIRIEDPEPRHLAEYLCHLYTEVKLAPRTIALHKSVVSNFSNPLRSEELSSHPLVKQIVKGAFAAKPPTRKFLSWKTEDLLSFLKTYEFDEDSLFAASRHSCVLLLLATGRRVHDLTLLSIANGAYEDNGDEIILWPVFGSKTDSHSYRQSGWLLKKGAEDLNRRLDLVFWIKQVISVSSERRGHRGLENLFITTRGAPKNASRTVIAGWIRTLFKQAGISASAGSFRAAVASHNWVSNQHSIDEILQRGNWRSSNTFFKHYFRELPKPPATNINELSSSFSIP